jgi:chromosome segregation ATPase
MARPRRNEETPTPDGTMKGTDFFDEDLQNRDRDRRPADSDEEEDGSRAIKRPVSDLNLTRMGKQREDIDNQVAASSQELERLRIRKEEIEKERRELEDLRRKQEDYVTARRDLSERLTHSLVSMEKEQVRMELVTEMLQTGRSRFKNMREEIGAIDEESWSEDQMRDELTKSLALLEESRMEYNSTMAKLDATMADGTSAHEADGGKGPSPHVAGQSSHSFGYWCKAGFAFLLPGMLFVTSLIAVLIYLYRAYS